MNLELDGDKKAALIELLCGTIEGEPFPALTESHFLRSPLTPIVMRR